MDASTITVDMAAEERRATHATLSLLSPCRAETKEQDSAGAVDERGVSIAVVCDGTTQSMNSAEAARLVASNPAQLWNGSLPALVQELLSRRAAIVEAAPPSADSPSFLTRAFAKIMDDARSRSFQTTFVTARITPLPGASRVLIEVKACGDSGVLVFGSDGELHLSNLPTSDSGFAHLSPLTEVLPDHYSADDVLLSVEVDRTVHVVLCSDGFYDAFGHPRELFEWLVEHRDELHGEGGLALLDALHDRLDARTGDDDITLVWLTPTEPVPEAQATELPAPALPKVRGVWRLLLALRRWIRSIVPQKETS